MDNRLLLGVGKREMSALAAKPRRKLRRLAMELQDWTLAGPPKHLDAPVE